MRILNLDRLTGPGKSVSENFECLMLAILTAHNSEDWCRLNSPDHGMDLYSGKMSAAVQCKAYARFRSDLPATLEDSVQRATAARGEYPWDLFCLAIPFVPTAGQRTKLSTALECTGQRSRIWDGDYLEAILYDKPEITSRFFPDVQFISHPRSGALTLNTGSDAAMLRLSFTSSRTQQAVPLKVSSDASCAALVNFLTAALKLPDKIAVRIENLTTYVASVEWNIVAVQSPDVILDRNLSLTQCGLSDGMKIGLFWKVLESNQMQFMRDSPPENVTTELSSTQWNRGQLFAQEFSGDDTAVAMSEYVSLAINSFRRPRWYNWVERILRDIRQILTL